jgi:O-methyltransferase
MACPESDVRRRLQLISFPESRVKVHRGFVDATTHARPELPERVAFAYIDFDFYEPIMHALQLLETRVPVGARIVVDDYDWFSTGAKAAVTDWLSAVNRERTHYVLDVPPQGFGHFAILTKQGT